MTDTLHAYPETETLKAALTSVFHANSVESGSVRALTRKPNPYTSTYPTEIVRCTLDGSADVPVLCKYQAGRTEIGEIYRRGLQYECAVYERILRPLKAGPRFYGAYIHPDSGDYWLILEYVEQSFRVSRAVWNPDPMVVAARWLGQFHAQTETLLATRSSATDFLLTYDKSHYLEFLTRTVALKSSFESRHPWLSHICDVLQEWIPTLVASPRCLIHGEFYPPNVLFRAGEIYPIDWQSAAVAAGEMDLVCLTAGWRPDLVQECDAEYCKARWPNGRPHTFDLSLAAARLYWPLMFIGARAEHLTYEQRIPYLENLRRTSERLGLI